MAKTVKKSVAEKIKLGGYDALFGVSEYESAAEHVVEVALSDLHEFKDHPFRVLNDEKMEETVESIRQYGVLVPGIARPRKAGGYEMIAGHRRKYACELAGRETMPIIVRNYSNDEATIIMVDSNIQREDILPSEKSRAYRMKYEALKHQGKKAGGRTIEEMGESAGESAKTVQRYIWLSRLSDDLLDLVDRKKLGFMQGLDISFVPVEAQEWVSAFIKEKGMNVNTAQSAKLKEYGKSGELTQAMVGLILSEERPKERKITLKDDKISRYFPDNYSDKEIESVILNLLERWKGERE